jgi:hypothetical protein
LEFYDMAEKIFGPLKKLPSQIQNLHLFRKAQDVIHKQTKGALCTSQQSLSFGFLEHTTCMAYDEQLSLLVVGTRNGSIRIFGQKGVVSHVGDIDEEIYHVAFVPHQGKLLTISGKMHANRISFWVFAEGKWKQDKVCINDDVRISSFCFLPDASSSMENVSASDKPGTFNVLVGTESGDLRLFSLKDFKFVDVTEETSPYYWIHEFSDSFTKTILLILTSTKAWFLLKLKQIKIFLSACEMVYWLFAI